jgi:hypothetical protein
MYISQSELQHILLEWFHIPKPTKLAHFYECTKFVPILLMVHYKVSLWCQHKVFVHDIFKNWPNYGLHKGENTLERGCFEQENVFLKGIFCIIFGVFFIWFHLVFW